MKFLSHLVLWSSLAAVAILSSGCGSDGSSDTNAEQSQEGWAWRAFYSLVWSDDYSLTHKH
jgi:hypothetical protein